MTALVTVTDTEVEIHSPDLWRLHRAAWEALNEWVEFHDIDPKRVPMCSRIVRNVDAYRVEYDQIVVGFDGAKVMNRIDDELVLVTRGVHSQGEAPPLPWPAVVWEAAR